MRTTLSLSILAALAAFQVQAQTPSVLSSRVVNSLQRPVANVTVKLMPQNLLTRTDAEGRFTFHLEGIGVRRPDRAIPKAARGATLFERGTGYYDFLGRFRSAVREDGVLGPPLRKTSGAPVEITLTSRGYFGRTVYLQSYQALDSVVTLPGRGIIALTPGSGGASAYVGNTISFMAQHAEPDEEIRLEFNRGGNGTWIKVQEPACMVASRYQDTCRFVVPSRFSAIGGTQDTAALAGSYFALRFISLKDDSVYSTGGGGMSILEKPKPEITTSFDTTVSIRDQFFLTGSAKDILGEPLEYSWRIDGNRHLTPDGRITSNAPATADTTLACDFYVKRQDGTEYAKVVKVKVLWDYPVVTPMPDTVISVHQGAPLWVKATQAYGSIKSYEWDFGNTGSWQSTPGNTVDFPGLSVLNPAYPVKVRVTDDDDLATTATLKLNVSFPHYYPGTKGNISDVLPKAGKGVYFLGKRNYNVWLGAADSLGRIEWSKDLRNFHPWHASDASTNRMVLNNQGDLTLITRTAPDNSTTFHLIRTSLTGDVAWEKTFSGEYLAHANQVIQAANDDYIVAYTERFRGCLARTDVSGTLKWKRQYPVFRDIHHALNLSNGNLIVVGWGQNHPTNFYSRPAMAEINPAGDTLWTRTYDYASLYLRSVYPVSGGYRALGGNYGNVTANGFVQFHTDLTGAVLDTVLHAYSNRIDVSAATRTPDGGYLTVAAMDPPDPELPRILLHKTDASGVRQWTQTLNTLTYGEIHAAAPSDDNGFMLGGYGVFSGFGQSAAMLLPLRPNGDLR